MTVKLPTATSQRLHLLHLSHYSFLPNSHKTHPQSFVHSIVFSSPKFQIPCTIIPRTTWPCLPQQNTAILLSTQYNQDNKWPGSFRSEGALFPEKNKKQKTNKQKKPKNPPELLAEDGGNTERIVEEGRYKYLLSLCELLQK